MKTHANLDRCGAAHRERALLNAAAEKSLEDWAMSLAPAAPGQAVLDLGCGAGKLTLPYARLVGPGGRVLGVDIAPDSLAALERAAQEEGLTNLVARRGELDTIVRELEGERFDLILSSYAIYYASDVVELLRALAELLAPGGRVFVCGPGEGTNREMAEMTRISAPEVSAPPPPGDFLSPEQITQAARAYAGAETHRLANTVRFRDAEAVLRWWRNHNMYAPAADAAVAAALREFFRDHDEFCLTKNVLGVLFRR